MYAKLSYSRDTRTAKDTITFKKHHIKWIYWRLKCIFNLYFLIITRFTSHERSPSQCFPMRKFGSSSGEASSSPNDPQAYTGLSAHKIGAKLSENLCADACCHKLSPLKGQGISSFWHKFEIYHTLFYARRAVVWALAGDLPSETKMWKIFSFHLELHEMNR